LAEENAVKSQAGGKGPVKEGIKAEKLKAGKPEKPAVDMAEKAGPGKDEKAVAGKQEKAVGKGKAAKKPVAKERVSGVKAVSGFLKRNALPVAIVAGIAIIVLAWAISSAPGQADVDDFLDNEVAQEKGVVKMVIVSSKRCPACEEGNSLQNLFNTNGIDYAVNRFGEISEEGQNLIKATGAKKLPLFIIEEESLTGDMLVKTLGGIAPLKDVLHFYVDAGKGSFEEGIFAFPEMNLDGLIRSNILLEEPCGNERNIMVHFFADPYDPNTIAQSRDYENFMALFDDIIDVELGHDINTFFEYAYIPTYSNIMRDVYLEEFGGKPEVVENNLSQPARYLICANDVFGTGKFVEMQRAIYSVYCDINAEVINSADIRPLTNCSDSNHYNLFLTSDELKEAAEEVGIYDDLGFSACLYNVESKIAKTELVARAAGIDRTPQLLLNCQYQVPVKNALGAACKINGNLRFC